MWFEFEVKCISLEVIHACFSIINYTPPALSTEAIFFSCPNTATVLVFIIIIIIREMSALNARRLTLMLWAKYQHILVSFVAALPQKLQRAILLLQTHPSHAIQGRQPLDTSTSEIKQWKISGRFIQSLVYEHKFAPQGSFWNFVLLSKGSFQPGDFRGRLNKQRGRSVRSGREPPVLIHKDVGASVWKKALWVHVCLECRAEGQQAALLCRSVWCLLELQFICIYF